MRIRYTSRAGNDLDIAFEWYEGQRRGLGFDFLDCVEVTIETIQQMPKLYAEHHEHFRRALVRRFPFSIFYFMFHAFRCTIFDFFKTQNFSVDL